MAEPTAARTVGTGEHVLLSLHGWFGSATGWGWLPNADHHAPEETPVSLVTSVEELLARQG